MDKYVAEVEILEGGKLPVRANPTDAGFDVFATEDVYFKPGVITKHPLNIKIKLPPNTFIRVAGKSGLGSKGLSLTAEIIDESYRGIPHVVGTSISSDIVFIKAGEKICQLIFHPFNNKYHFKEVDHVSEDTDRGAGGFGSSGV